MVYSIMGEIAATNSARHQPRATIRNKRLVWLVWGDQMGQTIEHEQSEQKKHVNLIGIV